MYERDHQKIKDLALRYQSNEHPDTWAALLVETDDLLLYFIKKAIRTKPYIGKIGVEDLYQIAVIGLHRAVLKFKKEEPGSKLIYKIWRYVGHELVKEAKHYSSKGKVTFSYSSIHELIQFQVSLRHVDLLESTRFVEAIENGLIDISTFGNLDREDVRDMVRILIEDGVISDEEINMICKHVVDKIPYKDVAKSHNVSASTASTKINKALNRMRYEFRRRSWN